MPNTRAPTSSLIMGCIRSRHGAGTASPGGGRDAASRQPVSPRPPAPPGVPRSPALSRAAPTAQAHPWQPFKCVAVQDRSAADTASWRPPAALESPSGVSRDAGLSPGGHCWGPQGLAGCLPWRYTPPAGLGPSLPPAPPHPVPTGSGPPAAHSLGDKTRGTGTGIGSGELPAATQAAGHQGRVWPPSALPFLTPLAPAPPVHRCSMPEVRCAVQMWTGVHEKPPHRQPSRAGAAWTRRPVAPPSPVPPTARCACLCPSATAAEAAAASHRSSCDPRPARTRLP